MLRQSPASALKEGDDFVQMGVDTLGEWATGLHLLVVLLHKAITVLLRSPLSIVDDAGPVCASVECRPDHAGLTRDLLDEANPFLDVWNEWKWISCSFSFIHSY